MAALKQGGNEDLFDSYFRRADLDGDGRISGAEAVGFFQGSGLQKQVLAQVWAYADPKKVGYLGRMEFYNALKLVTVAQSKRELTPDIVKAALYGPASAKIPAPQMNLAATPSPQPRAPTPVTQSGGVTSPSYVGSHGSNNPQYTPSQQSQFRPPQAMPHTATSQLQQNIMSQGIQVGGPMTAGSANTLPSIDLVKRNYAGSSGQQTLQPPNQAVNLSTYQNASEPAQPRPQIAAGQMNSLPPKPQESALPSTSQNSATPSNLLVQRDNNVSGNGFASNSLFGDASFVAATQPKQISSTPSSTSNSSVSAGPGTVVATVQAQVSSKQSPVGPVQDSFSQQPVSGQYQHRPPTGKLPQHYTSGAAPGISAFPGGSGNSSQFAQSPLQWPKMTQADVQKYAKVFVQVDTDRDGKITGNQARNLFLSWKLPREVLKQVWDLSDQDNDSKLSLREFCIALYLMERYREGRPLPPVLPSTIIPSESLFSVASQPAAPYGNATWGQAHGFQQRQVQGASRPPPAPRGKPPRPVPAIHSDGAIPPAQQKRKVPVLEKHLVDQLSKEEQDSLNTKLQEATVVDKKVEELEKEITDSRQKIEFYRAKMQELVLYKSRCDNRLNEITERVSGDKREVESLAKKYEEKYKQRGDVASKLSIEEATFRDLQEKKMELYQAIVKFEEGNPQKGVLKERAQHIQRGLEETVKILNERCKQYGLRGKPTSLAELPFGWQPGIQEGAADWDEEWDKFEEEGFTFVKEFTLDVQNVIAPSKPKGSAVQKEEEEDFSSSCRDDKTDKNAASGDNIREKESPSEQADAKSLESRARNGGGDEPQEFQDSGNVKSSSVDGSTDSKDKSEHDRDGDDSTVSGGKSSNEPSKATFDSHYDGESSQVATFDSNKVVDHERQSDRFGLDFGDFGDFNLRPIKTGSTSSMGNMFPGKSSIFADSVPSTPAYNFDSSPRRASIGSDLGAMPLTSETPCSDYLFPGKSSFTFADSVPTTPAYSFNKGTDFGAKHFSSDTPRSDNLFAGKISSVFADSVPSTPAYSFDKGSDFGGRPFASETPRSDNLFSGKSLFADSVPGTPAYNFESTPRRFNDYSFDSFSRFDSFGLHDTSFSQSPRHSLSRSDSARSTSDPFASRFDSFNMQRFDSFNSQSFDSFGAHESGFSQSPKNFLARFDSMGSTKNSDFGHGFSFDDSDPFGSSGPFKTTAETPKGSDNWRAF